MSFHPSLALRISVTVLFLNVACWAHQQGPDSRKADRTNVTGVQPTKPIVTKTVEAQSGKSDAAPSIPLPNNTAAPAAKSTKHVKQPERITLLDDYVPCMFDDDTGAGLRESTLPERRLSEYQAQVLIDVSQIALEAAVEKTVSDFNLTHKNSAPIDTSTYIKDIVKAFHNELSQLKLDNYTEEVALEVIKSAAASALSVSTKDNILLQPVIDQVVAEASVSLEKAAGSVKPPSTSTYTRPDDVSCSMAIMGWHETSDTFGRRVANEYLAIQVTIRNLNPTNEFLVHDVQVAVDSGIKNFTRFQVGRDKLLVRDVAQRGASEDRRNVALAALEAVGAIAGSSAIAGSRDFATAIAVYQGALIPAYSKLFPDHTIDQLNHINDLAFSSSSSSKVIVPIQGAVPLVTFVLAKPIQQMPFAWCGYDSVKRTFTGRRLRQYCASDYDNFSPGDRPSYTDVYGINMSAQVQDLEDATKAVNRILWDELPYKKWRAAALQILQQRTFVVISGIHIKEVPKAASTASIGEGLDCGPTLSDGSVDMSSAKDGNLTCKVSGINLQNVASVKLELGSDKIPATIKASIDGTSAACVFDASSLADGNGTYTLFLVDRSGAETSSEDEVKLTPQPYVMSVSDTLDLSQAKPVVTVTGKNLDRIATASLVGSSGAAAANIAKPTNTTSLELSFADVSKFKSGESYFLHYTVNGYIEDVDAVKSVKAINKPKAAARPR